MKYPQDIPLSQQSKGAGGLHEIYPRHTLSKKQMGFYMKYPQNIPSQNKASTGRLLLAIQHVK